MLKVWGRRNSINVQKVLWLVGEMGLSYDHVPAGGAFGRLSDPDFQALNPNGVVPVIEDGETAVWESHSILRYLAASHGDANFWPSSVAARSISDRWMDWGLGSWQPAFITGVFWGYYRTPEDQRHPQAVAKSIQDCGSLMRIVENALAGHDFLAGDRLSLADIPIGASLFRYFELDIQRPPLPRVEAWYRRLKNRPAYREHVMVAFDDLKGRLAF